MDSRVFRAILAMDSYNRGYDAGLRLSSTNSDEIGLQIGLASVVARTDSVEGSDARSASFYAIAYTRGSETVVSYRGTDTIPFIGTDAQTGWPQQKRGQYTFSPPAALAA